ncbi:class II aldolase/adducin family protein [Acerihabitans sp.]|uniref:class II aldolase/adducin family protein n=1 Tax=Acerihabitans sp. TaxID=2811394 RepID=UPI002ED993B0
MNDITVSCPRKIVDVMNLIYRNNLTTVSGGNLSILDDNGDVWITPSGVDKGNLQVEDIVRVSADGACSGRHIPSIELPFHLQIYQSRPDIRAIIHAHPPALIAASLVHKTPPVGIAPVFKLNCAKVDIAPYALPGSRLLGENIARQFAQGCDAVILENHGIAVGDQSLDDAWRRFELLNFCAAIAIHGTPHGPLKTLDDAQCEQFWRLTQEHPRAPLEQEHLAERNALSGIAQRVHQKGLSPAGFFFVSQRLEDDTVLMSLPGQGLHGLTEHDFVRLPATPAGPSLAALHQAIYARHPRIRTIMMALPPHAMGFACTGAPFDSRLIPESYMVMRQVKMPAYAALFDGSLPDLIDRRSDVLLIQNAMVIVCGESPLKAYDRLEVLEFSARAGDYARAIGDIVHIPQRDIDDIHQAFNL